MKVKGKDDLGRPTITGYRLVDIPPECQMQASDVSLSTRRHIMDHVHFKPHAELALECIELTLSRPGIHGQA